MKIELTLIVNHLSPQLVYQARHDPVALQRMVNHASLAKNLDILSGTYEAVEEHEEAYEEWVYGHEVALF